MTKQEAADIALKKLMHKLSVLNYNKQDSKRDGLIQKVKEQSGHTISDDQAKTVIELSNFIDHCRKTDEKQSLLKAQSSLSKTYVEKIGSKLSSSSSSDEDAHHLLRKRTFKDYCLDKQKQSDNDSTVYKLLEVERLKKKKLAHYIQTKSFDCHPVKKKSLKRKRN